MIRLILVLLVAPLISWGCSETANEATSNPGSAGPPAGLRFTAPDDWVAEPTSSTMRVAQYRLPRAEGDAEDASLVIYYFGQGQGGSVQANLDRWVGQIEQPDGRPSRELARTETITVNGLRVAMLDVSGTYTAETAPGSGTRLNKLNYRLRAAVIETSRGPYFVKLVGPEKTIGQHEKGFDAFIRSIEHA